MSSIEAQKKLLSLLEGLRYKELAPSSGKAFDELHITTITSDSRKITPGCLFVALRGAEQDGHDYIEDAAAKGCTAVICETGAVSQQRLEAINAVAVEVDNSNGAYAALAVNYYERPAEHLKLIGVTGTNGKTTVTYLLEHVLIEAGFAVGVIGTVNNRYTTASGRKTILSTQFTTPEALLLQKLLREMADAGVDYVIMEVSSHALAQARVGGVLFDVVAMTNLSRDHLDYHQNMEDYFDAKSRLFSEHVKELSIAVLPTFHEGDEDRDWLLALHNLCKQKCEKIIGWGDEPEAEIRPVNISMALEGAVLEIQTATGLYSLSSPLVGRFNIDNVLTVFGLCSALQLEDTLIVQALSTASGAPGRLERVQIDGMSDYTGPAVFVDYAHTPDALEKVLVTVGGLPHSKLFSVFGCGGDRDKGKRPVMGEIGSRLSDIAIITDDNPRTEDPDLIVSQILQGIDSREMATKNLDWLQLTDRVGRGYVVIRDRQQAIESAIKAAGPGDIVVIAGKGHEPYQVTIHGKRFFDDRMVAGNTLLSWTRGQIATAVKGVLHSESTNSALLGSVITDSRVSSRNGIFVALKGENHDGHEYVNQAVTNGVTCLVVEKKIPLLNKNVSQVVVSDTQKALGDLAAFRRKKISDLTAQKVIGITGSCGKTTVKEMVAVILERMWPKGPDFPENCVLKTQGNFNNLIGLPLSLLPLDTSHKAAVLEMGMNQPGELQRLAEIGDPDISCIVNIHGAHLEGLESIEGVARAKEELFAGTKSQGTLVINLDDDRVRKLSGKYLQTKITYSVAPDKMQTQPDIWTSSINCEDSGCITFTLHHRDDYVDVHLYTAGEHNVSNALAAAAIGVAAGAELDQIAAGLADFRPPDKRMQMLSAGTGYNILNDTYNANPASMTAGLKTLKQMAKRTSVALVGDMLELGDTSVQAHFDIGKLIAELKIDYVGVVGNFKDDIRRGAVSGGFEEEKIKVFESKENLVSWMYELIDSVNLGKDDLVLVKASRGLRFETIVEKLVE